MSRSCRAVLIAAVAVLCHAGAASAALTPCDFAHEGGLCGSVSVPLDRSQPSGAQIDIKFVVFGHTDTSQPSQGTIFVTEGGPGYSVINNVQDGYSKLVFGPLLDHRDLVMIDQRGTGQSGAVSCDPLQQEIGDIYAAAAKCGSDLGASAQLYGSADVAKDIEAVRASLGVDKFDYYGGSYAGADIEAYAVRYPQHLRSVALDSPVVISAEDPWFTLGADQTVKTVERVCARSASCSAANHNPASDLSRLAKALRKAPVKGKGHDADGHASKQTVTEARLVRILQSDAGGAVVQGEITAAARALRKGDRAPLLRLAAENDHPVFSGDPADPTLYSLGDGVARFCVDQTFPWDKQASAADRKAQYDQARAALSPDRFAPFSVDAWAAPAPLGLLPDPCIGWPAPTAPTEPVVPSGAVASDVPALVITGDLDQSVPQAESAHAAEIFPHNTMVNLQESGHHTVFSAQSQCAQDIVRSFIATLDAGDTSCASHPAYKFSGVGRFPVRVGSRRAAAQAAGRTVLDALLRTFMASEQEKPIGVGLRGGKYHGQFFDDHETIHLQRARYARNVAVTGDANLAQYTMVGAKLKVGGAFSGTVRVRGLWNDAAATRLKITGRLGGKPVKTTIPAN